MVQPILVFFTPARMILPIPVYLGAFRRGSTHPRIFSMRLDANGEGYDPSLCIFDVINANTTTTTKPTPFKFVGYYCTPGGGREERSSCLYVHHFFLSFFKNLFCICNEGFPSQRLYKTYVEGQRWKKIISTQTPFEGASSCSSSFRTTSGTEKTSYGHAFSLPVVSCILETGRDIFRGVFSCLSSPTPFEQQ